jgi:ATP-dependent DNA ligase
MTDDYRYKKVFVVFDLLMLNNEEYFQKPLVERLKALNSFVFEKTDQNVVFISEKQEVSKVNDLLNFYNNHLAQGEEGIVIKV